MTNGNGVYDEGEKAIDPAAIRSSVIDVPPAPNSRNPVPGAGAGGNIFWFLGQSADEMTAWGHPGTVKRRDKELRDFITKEPIFASALNIICQRNAGFSWKLDGPPKTINRVQEILETANMGRGWQDLIVKVSIDLYTQDNGAFIEIVRARDSADSPVIGINHLDSARCTHTGNPLKPVIYQDRMGKLHLLDWYNVVTLAEMPCTTEGLYGQQYSALTRLLIGAQIQRNLNILESEKSAGRETRAIHLVKGITTNQMQDAVNEARVAADAKGLMRYMSPIIVGSVSPNADVGHDTIDLAGWKPNFDEKLNFDHYINLISMAFSSDYQEFAPLPGGGLGTGAQSEMLHLKSRGKGPGRFMKLIGYFINFCVVPKNVKFFWAEQDLEAEKLQAEVKAIRAQTRATRVQSFEITPEVARQIANDEGDLALEFLAMMGEEDISENVTIDDASRAEAQDQDLGKPVRVIAPAANRVAARSPNPLAARPTQPQQQPA